MTRRPFAVFDIDGTLIRWQLYHATVDEMAKRRLLTPAAYKRVQADRASWKARSQEESYSAYEESLVAAHNKVITNVTVDMYTEIAAVVFEKYKDQTYRYTRNLIRDLQAKNYLLFAISGSQIEIVSLLANYYGFDASAGSIYERQGTHYTGNELALRAEHKIAALERLIKEHQASTVGSIAIGDSESDIPILQRVETAIAFNPTRLLFAEAKDRGWQVIIERKNMIYQLQKTADTYTLIPE